MICANRNHAQYAAYGHPVVADVVAEDTGPLAGLHAGLTACRTEFLCSVPCDAPFVALDLVARLSAAMDDGVAAVVAEAGGQRHPVFCLMRTTVVDDLAPWLASGGRAVHRWIERLPHRAVSFDDEQAFVNLNTLEELRAVEVRVPRAP